MDWNGRKFIGYMVILISLLSLISFTGANLQVYQGDSVSLENANTTLTWGRNYSFNISKLAVSNETLSIGNRNISVYADNATPVNATLWQYNLSNPSYGDTLIRLGVEPVNATIHFGFTGVSVISSDKYQLRTSSSKLNSFRSGGAVSWSHSGRSGHNFTVNYEKIVRHGGDDGSTGGGSSGGVPYTPADCGLTGDVQSHSWSLVNRTSFSFDNTDSNTGIQRISIKTRSNQNEFKICSKKIENRSETPTTPSNTYAVYRFKTAGADDSQISSAKIRFTVNKSFADQYDRIVLSRYSNGWTDLPTTKTGSSGNKLVYEASSSDFSYYAVRGQNNQTQNQTNSTNKTGPICGDNTCNANENWKTCSNDCQKPQQVAEAENSIASAEQQIQKGEKGYQTLQQARQQLQNGNYTAAKRSAEKALSQNREKNENLFMLVILGLILVTVLVLIGYFGWNYWRERQMRIQIKDIKQKTHEQVEHDEVNNSEQMYFEIDRAKKALELNKYNQAKKYLDNVEQYLK